MYEPGTRTLVGVDAVIDTDRASAVLAHDLGADALVIATDTDAVYQDWGTPEARAIAEANPVDLEALCFPAGSMGPRSRPLSNSPSAPARTRYRGADRLVAAARRHRGHEGLDRGLRLAFR